LAAIQAMGFVFNLCTIKEKDMKDSTKIFPWINSVSILLRNPETDVQIGIFGSLWIKIDRINA